MGERRPAILWATVGAAALGLFVVLEIVARRHGVPGPLTNQARELVYAPHSGPLLYAGLALMMVVLTMRQRLLAAGAAIGIDLVFWLVRWAAGAAMNFGNGALWVIVGCAGIALTRRKGRERVLLLKGAGLGLLLVAGHKSGDTWLLITSKTRPWVLDPYVATADHALGDPSWVAGRMVAAAGPVASHVLQAVYGQLPLAAALVALYQLRHVAAERRFPGHHLVHTFLVIGLLGPVVYMAFPVVGPVFAYGADGGRWAVADVWPGTPPSIAVPHPVLFDRITPRNCMPSLHTAWATAIFVHSRKGSRIVRFAGAFWLLATLGATLGFGYHYGVDLVAGVVFALTVEAAMRLCGQGWDRPGIRMVGYGAVVFTGLLAAYRYLPVEMAGHPWVFGPLLLLALASVILAYVRAAGLWDPKAPPPQRPDPPLVQASPL